MQLRLLCRQQKQAAQQPEHSGCGAADHLPVALAVSCAVAVARALAVLQQQPEAASPHQEMLLLLLLLLLLSAAVRWVLAVAAA
jgi:hypothetical protein